MSTSFTAPIKDPASILDHAMSWTAWLGDDLSIASHQVLADSNALIISQSQVQGGEVSWRVAGGELGRDHTVTVEITTDNGQVDQRSVTYPIRQR
ncbi:phage fiber-tail adaptor protein [Erythrobacter rubeus]|uniref:Uncharacterized protein n=1 Tax=Erythrobacter rubeus TaxID=2760803 RepID=A0ABR8KPQ5_9SPHN|nr:hypothetical protein [Erythrobacter rubeus]MBD2842723.1 hypothetical protein [Erythrobacter rubeus]